MKRMIAAWLLAGCLPACPAVAGEAGEAATTGSGAAVAMSIFPVLDTYGQAVGLEWPGKIANDEQLRDDARREAALLDNQRPVPDPERFDRFGGRREGLGLEATGFFRVEKIDGRWWFITPEGNRFFMVGVDAVVWRDQSAESVNYGTPLLDPDGSERPELARRPAPEEDFPECYAVPGRVNFLAANLRRKYGPGFVEKFDDLTRRRLRAWGFNASGMWGFEKTVGLPYIENKWSGRDKPRVAPGLRAIDMYDPGFADFFEPYIRESCERRRGDPMLLAYSVENENGWSPGEVANILKAGPESHAKGALLDYLAERGGGDWTALAARFDRTGDDRAALLAAPLAPEAVTAEESAEFIRRSSARYHRILRELYRKHDPDHMFMGAAHYQGQSPEWYLGMAPHVDFLAFNIYALSHEWLLGPVMSRLRAADRPFAVTEFSFEVEDRGMRACNPQRTTVRGQRERGLAYRDFTENAAADPLCVGFGYFLYYDQPVAGRMLPYGEAHNFGLVNQCDQPYEEMLAEVKTANGRLFAVHDGKEKPHALSDPKALLGSDNARRVVGGFLAGTTAPEVVADTSRPDRFGGIAVRLKVGERHVREAGVYTVGVVDAGADKAFSGFSLDVYVWKNASDPRPADHFVVEASADNAGFAPVELAETPGAPGEFNGYTLSPARALASDARYLRFGIRVKQPKLSWVASFGRLALDTGPFVPSGRGPAIEPASHPEPSKAPDADKASGPFGVFAPGTMAREIAPDRSNPESFGGVALRYKVDERRATEPGVYTLGVADAGGDRTFSGFTLDVFVWKSAPDPLAADHFVVEASADNKTFAPVELTQTPGAPGTFNGFALSPARPLGADARYLRFGIRVKDPKLAWVAQAAGLTLTPRKG